LLNRLTKPNPKPKPAPSTSALTPMRRNNSTQPAMNKKLRPQRTWARFCVKSRSLKRLP